MTPEERRKRMEERMAQMSPEDRERFQARMREGGGGRGGFGGGNGAGGSAQGGFGGNRAGAPGQGGTRAGAQAGNRQAGAGATQEAVPSLASRGTTIDSLFGPLPTVETRGTAWQYENKQLKMIRLRLGVSDGSFSEILNETDVPASAEVVTSMTTGLEQRTTTPGQQQNNPLMGPQRGGPGGGGRGPGGGGRGF